MSLNIASRYRLKQEDRKALEAKLIANLNAAGPALTELFEKVSNEWGYEDHVYRFYHQSFKVYYLQAVTKDIVKALAKLDPEFVAEPSEVDPNSIEAHMRERGFPDPPPPIPDYPFLNKWFMTIMKEGTGHAFKHEHNNDWLNIPRKIVEAFFHARFFLEMAVRYKTQEAVNMLPSGWAAFLYLYDLR